MNAGKVRKFLPARPRWLSQMATILAAATLVTGAILLATPGARAEGKKVVWKPVTQALLKRNDRPVKTWDVLRAEKNHDLLLVQIERDWYIFSLKQKRVYQVNPHDYTTRGANLFGPEPDRHTPEVKTAGWDSHDIGPAQQITVRLAEAGETIAIELPHPLVVY